MAIADTQTALSGFESDDPVLADIYDLPTSCRTLERALPEALRLACSLPDWSLGRFRFLTEGLDGRAWRWCRGPDSPADGTPPGLAGLDRGAVDTCPHAGTPSLSLELLRPSASRLHAVLHAAGLRTVGRLVVRAEDRTAALLEVFGWARVDGRDLRLLLARLEHVAVRDRSREAVRRAAAYVRAHADGRPGTGRMVRPEPPSTSTTRRRSSSMPVSSSASRRSSGGTSSRAKPSASA